MQVQADASAITARPYASHPPARQARQGRQDRQQGQAGPAVQHTQTPQPDAGPSCFSRAPSNPQRALHLNAMLLKGVPPCCIGAREASMLLLFLLSRTRQCLMRGCPLLPPQPHAMLLLVHAGVSLSERPIVCSDICWQAGEAVLGCCDHAAYVVSLAQGGCKRRRTLYSKTQGHTE